MKNLLDEMNGIFDVAAGSRITDVITEAIALSEKEERIIRFEFNGVIVSVSSNSDPELIHRDCLRSFSGYIDKNVGPNPSPVLTDEERASDASIAKENERKNQERQAKRMAENEARREAVEAKLVDAPGIDLIDEACWQNNKDINSEGYGGAVMAYAERWARLMQIEIANGKKLEDVAGATSDEADLEGITGFMTGGAISILSHCWKYGKQLQRWYTSK